MKNLRMPTLHFMPWCRLDREYRTGPVALTPFSRDQPPANFDPDTTRAVSTILADFIGVDGNPVPRCTLVVLEGRVFVDGFGDRADFETIYDYAQMACLSSLEGREHLGRAEPYSNAECFALYARQYRDGDAVAAPIRRRDSTLMGLAGAALRVHMPVQAIAVPRPPLNEPLYLALAELRQQMLDGRQMEDWAAWAESIYSFNLANTDREDSSRHVEWVLMCSAIERLLRARSSAIAFADKVVAAVNTDDGLSTCTLEVIYEWAEEFYRLRNDFAHGKLRSRQPRKWNSDRHLLLGSIMFPLLVKHLLARVDIYRLIENDRAEIAAFSRFAADLRDPASQLSTWHQYVRNQQK